MNSDTTVLTKAQFIKLKELGSEHLANMPQDPSEENDLGVYIPPQTLQRLLDGVFEYRDLYYIEYFNFRDKIREIICKMFIDNPIRDWMEIFQSEPVQI